MCSPSASSKRNCAKFSRTTRRYTFGRHAFDAGLKSHVSFCSVLDPAQAWVVLKFGGTSVSSAANWHNIAQIIRARLGASFRPVVVHSALSGITDRLESLLSAALSATHAGVLDHIDAVHRKLAAELGVVPNGQFEAFMQELRQLVNQLALDRCIDDALRARVMAMGELLATTLGETFLNSEAIGTKWVDARGVMRSDDRYGATEKDRRLSATCDFSPDTQLQSDWLALNQVVITQGFIAANPAGETVLLGRGGSDTSGAYLAAKLSAARLEIWTDVPGLFSANPRAVPTARLLRQLHYDEAQEIASNGAKVLHPRCVLPLRQYKIPLHVYATQAPGLEGTVVSAEVADSAAQVKAIAIKKGITLVSMESPGMWHQVGFLADAFAVFKQHGLSVDLVSTSETNVTVSLDPSANTLDGAALEALTTGLRELCRVEILGPCASLSLLGQNIRGILHELGSAFELFQDQKIYLVTQAANDLNFTFVIDESQGDRLVQQLHERLIQSIGSDKVLGPTWAQLFSDREAAALPPVNWWEQPAKRNALIEIATRESAAFVYDTATLEAAIAAVLSVKSVKRWAYAMKANWHPQILRCMYDAGLTLECVSQGEIEHAFASVAGLNPERVLFTPNFAPRSEYEFGFAKGVRVTVDSLYPIKMWPEIFQGKEIFLRIDPGFGRGHHSHVRTAGVHSKFGLSLSDADELVALIARAKVRVIGLHAHTGSGIFDVANWTETGVLLAELARRFPEVRIIDLGGGIGVPEQSGHSEMNLTLLDRGVAELAKGFPHVEFWMEPGRFMVAKAGVLVAVVTQLKSKGDVQYVGIATGMNSLIRPALYGAHHDIRNLSRLEQPMSHRVNVVGPICESADLLGADRWLPRTEEGDVLLIATCGAYGYAMSSNYNRRPAAREFMI
jgi:bifunctional diaminopimelate decarboxylase / aspartate kinase